jgi:PAS domain S-box-containing protein
MNWEKLGSLRIRLMALVLFALAPALAFIIYSSFERRDELDGEFRSDARNLAAMAATSGRAPLESAKRLIDSLAGLPEIGQTNVAACRELFISLMRISEAFANIGLVSPDGNLICSGVSPPLLSNYADRDWFVRAVATGNFTVSGFVVSRVTGRPVIVLAQPVKDESGAVSSVVYISVGLDWFHSLIDEIKLPAGTTVSVIDRAGAILARRPEETAALGQIIPNAGQVMDEVLSGDLDINEEWGIDGKKRLYAFSAVLSYPGNEIYMRVGIPLALALERVEWAMWRSLVFLGLAGLVILVGTHLFSEAMILRPVRRLVDAAGYLGAGGRLDKGRLGRGTGEFAELGRAFERMAGFLREKMRFTQMLIDSIPVPIYYKDHKGIYIGCNQQYEKDVKPRAGVIGKTVFDIYDQKYAQVYFHKDQELQDNPPTQIYESEMIYSDGSRRDVMIYKAVTHDDEGAASGIVGAIMDITERKSLETRLTRAKEAAEAANEVKTRFLASVSHEIRTPMNSIMGMTELLLHGELSLAQRDFLEAVEESSKNLLLLIDGILDFAKIEAGELGLESIDFDPRRLIGDAMRPLRAQAGAKGVGLVLDIDPSLPACLKGDPVRLRQILVNLAGNAVKFTEKGSVRVFAGLAEGGGPLSPDGPVVVFKVEDSGIGIPEEKLKEIFEPFRQADGSVTRRYGGTGLGLAISSELAAMMGGEIRVESLPGRGSVFTFAVKLGRGDPERVKPVPGERLRGASPPARSLRVLVVDDNEINRKVGQALLDRLGHSSRAAGGGEQALNALRAERYDVVLMDLEMPGMDGFSVTQAIRAGLAGERAANMPVIAVTAHALAGYRERCMRAGMVDFVTKPVSLGALASSLSFLAGEQQVESGGNSFSCSGSLLDEAEALARLGGDRELLADLTDRFVVQAPDKLVQIRQAMEAGDYEGVAQAAHALRGICGAVGATRVQEAAQRLEQAAKEREAGMDGLRANLQASLGELLDFLNLKNP